MHFLGIDYGTKRVGVAIAHEPSNIATPLTVLWIAHETPETIAHKIAELARKHTINTIVIGESKDFQGVDNPVMKKARMCAEFLAKELTDTARIVFEPEFLTTQQAQRIQGDHSLIDASAAALILQSYLDRLRTV